MSMPVKQFDSKMADSEAAKFKAHAQGGDRDAHDQLMVSHRRIVARLAKQYAQGGLSSEELIRFGEQGLGVAIEKFNLSKGFSFSTYATWWIRQAITRGFGDGSGASVREPRAPRPSSGFTSAGR